MLIRLALLPVASLALFACDGDPVSGRPNPAFADSVAVVANPTMVVSVLVSYRGAGDSARVRYRLASGGADSATPAVTVPDGRDTVAVLGLLPATAYHFRLVVYGGTAGAPDSFVAAPLPFTTGALPADLPAYSASGAAPSSGYVVFSAAPFGIVIDRTGRVVWYLRFPGGGPGLNFMAQPTGSYVGRLVTPDAGDDNPMVEIDAAGFQLRQLRCAGDRPLRFHDLLLVQDGSYWIMCDDTRTMDLTAVRGLADARVTGTAVQHVAADGALLFEWTPFDHIAFELADSALYAGAATVNWTHGNAIDLDGDGDLLVSFRSMDQILKISTQTGAVLWRLGGRLNDFTISGDAHAGFSRQHGVRATGPGELIVLDNAGNGVGQSRAERYTVDAVARTAQLAQSYGSTPSVLTLIGGSVQGLGGGRYLVSFGTEGRVEEYDASGATLWAIDGNPGYVFRAQRIRSLYAPVPALTR